jgi:hypothetical protein
MTVTSANYYCKVMFTNIFISVMILSVIYDVIAIWVGQRKRSFRIKIIKLRFNFIFTEYKAFYGIIIKFIIF